MGQTLLLGSFCFNRGIKKGADAPFPFITLTDLPCSVYSIVDWRIGSGCVAVAICIRIAIRIIVCIRSGVRITVY